jgi:hypothetical protein
MSVRFEKSTTVVASGANIIVSVDRTRFPICMLDAKSKFEMFFGDGWASREYIIPTYIYSVL